LLLPCIEESDGTAAAAIANRVDCPEAVSDIVLLGKAIVMTLLIIKSC
jgi:hypothetical protein